MKDSYVQEIRGLYVRMWRHDCRADLILQKEAGGSCSPRVSNQILICVSGY